MEKEMVDIGKVYVTESHTITSEENRLISNINDCQIGMLLQLLIIVMIQYQKRKCIVKLSLEEQKKEAL